MQGNKSIKMIALDLDGTTLNSAGRMSDVTAKTLAEAGEKGIYVVISTGRSYNSLPGEIKGAGGIAAYAITSNGAHINDVATGEAVYSSYLSDEAIWDVDRLRKELDVEIEVFVDGQAYMSDEYYRHIEKYGCEYRNADYVLWSRKPVEDIGEVLLENRNRIENVNFCFRNHDALEANRKEVESIRNATITSSFINNLEVGGPDTSKRSALIVLMNRLGIDKEELMCCGDAPNDIQMLELAGLGVAVGNAWGGTKDHADYVTGTNDEDGVAAAIRKFAL